MTAGIAMGKDLRRKKCMKNEKSSGLRVDQKMCDYFGSICLSALSVDHLSIKNHTALNVPSPTYFSNTCNVFRRKSYTLSSCTDIPHPCSK